MTLVAKLLSPADVVLDLPRGGKVPAQNAAASRASGGRGAVVLKKTA